MPTLFLSSSEDVLLGNIVGAMLDFMTLIPLAIVVLLVMLQDRRRPLWPAFIMMAPLIIGFAVCGISGSVALLPMLLSYYLLLGIGIVIYMVRALKQYGRWLRDNYADLEHKELWQSFLLLGFILLVFVVYAFENQAPVNKYVTQLCNILHVCYLLWRVETLSSLTPTPSSSEGMAAANASLFTLQSSLQKYCIDKQLYLQHDLTLLQLAKAIGTNRYYLSQYFSSQGMAYNTYINGLRIRHFMNLYQKAVATQRPFTARQLAFDSGYRSYSTFSAVFKQQKGQTVTAWMRDTAG